MDTLKNWNYKKVAKFLRDLGFEFFHTKDSSHEIWKDETRTVELYNSNNTKTLSPKGLSTILEQVKIPKQTAREWSTLSKKQKKRLKKLYQSGKLEEKAA